MTAGALVGVVGPSGVGKDSVMQALVAARPDLRLVQRVITRPETAGGEPFEGVSEAEFARRRAAGDFCALLARATGCITVCRPRWWGGWRRGRPVLSTCPVPCWPTPSGCSTRSWRCT